MVENGLNPEDLLGRRFGHHLNFWSMSERRLTQRVDLGDQHQMVFEVCPAHDPSRAWGFVGVVISVEDLSGSVWLWHRDGVGAWMAKLDAGQEGGLAGDPRFFPNGPDFRGLRVHQTRLQGGDASSDSYCHTR